MTHPSSSPPVWRAVGGSNVWNSEQLARLGALPNETDGRATAHGRSVPGPTFPLPTVLHQRAHTPWREVRTSLLLENGAVILMTLVGAVMGLFPTLLIWFHQASIDADTLIFWVRGGAGIGLLLGLVIATTNARTTIANALGERVLVDPTPFEAAAWATFRDWLAEGGHRQLRHKGCHRVGFVVAWTITQGDAVTHYGPLLRDHAADPDPHTDTHIPHRRSAWIPAEDAVPDPKARRRYVRQIHGHVSVEIGPFDVGTAHAILALEAIAHAHPKTAP